MQTPEFHRPRHLRPRWELFAFLAFLLGMIGLATIRSEFRVPLKAQKQAESPSATAGIPAP